MTSLAISSAAAAVAAAMQPLTGELEGLVEAVGDASFVLIGEASHGTREFYEIRAGLTRRLIQSKGFRVIALEADWPDVWRLQRYVRGGHEDGDAFVALAGFKRFPRWMWRNATMPPFLEWLREWNRPLAEDQVGLFGMDLYSLCQSMAAVIDYLDPLDPVAAGRARERYACFDHFGTDPENYAHEVQSGRESCEDEVVAQLMEMRRRGPRSGARRDELLLEAVWNAKVVAEAERYYRAMFRGRESWNLRDAHMDETVRTLARHYRDAKGDAKVAVWAHNSHVGDFRATEIGRRGEWSLGQLLRQRLGDRVCAIGFSTYNGSVTAADQWGDEPVTMEVLPGLSGSYEELFHEAGVSHGWLDLRRHDAAREALLTPRLQRAIGVVYRPRTERWSHYFHATLPEEFDLLIHFDETHALTPLDRSPGVEAMPPGITLPRDAGPP